MYTDELNNAMNISEEQLWAELSELLGAEQVHSKLIERTAYATDASIYRMMPQAVVMPRNENDVQKLLRYCSEKGLHLTYRAAGTSLSGQAVTNGIVVNCARHWKGFKIQEGGKVVVSQPGVVGGQLNKVLASYGCKIGPDPASIEAAMMGGIAANNASGLCCGVTENTYQTMKALKVMLADGYVLDSSGPDALEKLKNDRPGLVKGLENLRNEVLSDEKLAERIRHKFKIKNTTGYSLNALIDFDNPIDILTHLMIGSEGTLGFLSEIHLNTVPLPATWATSLLYFKDLADVGEVIFRLKEMGVAVVEFMDKASMLSVEDKMNYEFDLAGNCSALLVEFQEKDENDLQAKLKQTESLLRLDTLLAPYEFTREPELRNDYWSMRKGVYPSLGILRRGGTAVIIEDVVFPIERMPEAIPELQRLLIRSGFPDGIIFGHAKEGNLHPVVCEDFSSVKTKDRYSGFMDNLADLVINKYDGSFKGEHGTGRNVAPYVEMEWGEKAYYLMHRIKELFDPENILNPGVLLNNDPKVHLKNLKEMPVFSEIADACIECGFCEVRCPSHDLTLTPRQRISINRAMVKLSHSNDQDSIQMLEQLKREYQYFGDQTCAVDGMCATACPVKIDTGSLTKSLRNFSHTPFQKFLARSAAKNYGLLMKGVRAGLGAAKILENTIGPGSVRGLSRLGSILTGGAMPAIAKEVPIPGPAPKLPKVLTGSSDNRVVYFPSCLTRSMGAIPGENAPEGLAATIVHVLEYFGWNVLFPDGIKKICCSQPFISKGFKEEGRPMLIETIRALYEVSEEGQLTVICDTSPCTGQLLAGSDELEGPDLELWKKLNIQDLATFLAMEVMLKNQDLKKLPVHAVLHPTCTIQKIGAQNDFVEVARWCAEKVTVPVFAECCGFAGDRGFHFPELTLAATKPEAMEVSELVGDDEYRYLSTCRTCEMGMTAGTRKVYQSIAYLVAEAVDAMNESV